MTGWQRFFDGYADRYDGEVFTKNTEAEVEFLIEQLQLPAGAAILDVGCGTGRHTVGLASRGYRMTGVDLSSGMLAVAGRRAESAGVEVEWVHSNAADFRRAASFDAAICLCEGAMCLLGPDDDALHRDMTVLANILDALKPGATFVLNVLNACRHIRAYSDADIAAGKFNIGDLTESSNVAELLKDDTVTLNVRERGYTPPELRRMLIWTGFKVRGIYGGTAGDWGLRVPKLDEYELMAIVQRPA